MKINKNPVTHYDIVCGVTIFIYLFMRKGRVGNWHMTIEIKRLTGEFCDSNIGGSVGDNTRPCYDNFPDISYNNLSANRSSVLIEWPLKSL